MSKYLLSTTEIYRVSTEAEAIKMIEEAKENGNFILSKYGTTLRERKQKGEIIDRWYKVTLTKTFNDEKEPESIVDISYDNESAF